MVSVIIPTHNRIGYVQIALDSVFQQNYRNLEVIVVDDGSSDGTGRVLAEKYADRIQYVWQERHGASAARNRGISLANGEYVACLDSDDYWHADKLAFQVAAISKARSQRVAGVYSAAWVVNSLGEKMYPFPSGKPGRFRKNITLRDLLSGPRIFCPPSNMLVRRKCLLELDGYDEEISFCEDWDLVFRLRSKWDFAYVDRPLFYYRVHSSSQHYSLAGLGEQKISAILSNHLKVIQKNAQRLGWEGAPFVSEAKGKQYELAAYMSFAVEKWKQGVEFLVRATEFYQRTIPAYRLASQIGYWCTLHFVQRMPAIDYAESYLCSTILPRIGQSWDPLLGQFPSGWISGWYYHNLAFYPRPTRDPRSAEMCRKAIACDRRMFFSPSTVRAVVRDSLRNGFRN